jgi:hypothetical protein
LRHWSRDFVACRQAMMAAVRLTLRAAAEREIRVGHIR